MALNAAINTTLGRAAILGYLASALVACSDDQQIENSAIAPATSSKLSAITIPVPAQLQPYLAADKINSLRLKISAKQCDDGIVGTNVERFVSNFSESASVVANERIIKGCTYALGLSLGRANGLRTDFESIYLTNDTPKLWTIIEVPKTSPEKIKAMLRVFPTNDGKAFLGIPGTPIELQGPINPGSTDTETPDTFPSPIPGQQNQQPLLNWKIVLMASDQGDQSAWISAFDNARNRLVAFFQDRGVQANNIRQLSIKPQWQSQWVQPATTQSFTSTVANLNATGVKDACLIHLTSHGSRDGFNIGNSRLSPSALGAAMDAGCGAKPTVLLVSACYSGLYTLDASNLKKPNRVILTAARSDRTSFGCSAENELTFWDGCLIETLPVSVTFKDLASNIQSCISRKEVGISTPSLPQSFIGSEVESLRIP